MISKQCAGCGRYFAGQFDGDYICSECRHNGITPLRPLAPLDDHVAGLTVASDTKLPPRADAPGRGRRSARSQAA